MRYCSRRSLQTIFTNDLLSHDHDVLPDLSSFGTLSHSNAIQIVLQHAQEFKIHCTEARCTFQNHSHGNGTKFQCWLAAAGAATACHMTCKIRRVRVSVRYKTSTYYSEIVGAHEGAACGPIRVLNRAPTRVTRMIMGCSSQSNYSPRWCRSSKHWVNYQRRGGRATHNSCSLACLEMCRVKTIIFRESA